MRDAVVIWVNFRINDKPLACVDVAELPPVGTVVVVGGARYVVCGLRLTLDPPQPAPMLSRAERAALPMIATWDVLLRREGHGEERG